MAERHAVLRAWRLARGLMHSEVAELFGCSKTQAYRYEAGYRRIPPTKVPLIAAVTGIPPELLRPDVYRSVSRATAERELQAA